MTTVLISRCECGISFEYRPVMFGGQEVFRNRRICPACAEAIRLNDKARREAERLMRLKLDWITICPGNFLAFDEALLPSRDLYRRAMEWRYRRPGKGLLMAGESRTGKSRTAWQVLRREHFQGRHVACMTGIRLMRYVADLMLDGPESAGLLDAMAEADLLLLDDCFKAKMTPRAEEALFAIVDHRTQHGLPMLVTMNDSVDSLLPRLSEDRGAPLVARLKEFCEVLKV